MLLDAVRRTLGVRPALALAIGLVVPASAAAQAELMPGIAFLGGVLEYDLDGAGTTGFGALRTDLPLSQHFLMEPGVTYTQYKPGPGTILRLYMPEMQFQFQPSPGRFRPFIGVGIGAAFQRGGGVTRTDVTLSAGGGARFDFGAARRWGVHAEFRARSIDPWSGTMTEWTLGFSRRL